MIFPIKKQPLYMPMLGTFGGGSARGFNPGGSNLLPDLYSFTGHTFTAAQSGSRNNNIGPTLAQIQSAYSSTSWASNSAYLTMPTNSQGVQRWAVPMNGTYTMNLIGAGGASSDTSKNRGADVHFTVNLLVGQVLDIMVGQAGNQILVSGSGGGGSYVGFSDATTTTYTTTVLGVAGGGGGGRGQSMYASGTTAGDGGGSDPGTAGTNGNGGGGTPSNGPGGGGGGLLTAGTAADNGAVTSDSAQPFIVNSGINRGVGNVATGGGGYVGYGGFGGGGAVYINNPDSSGVYTRPGAGGGFNGGGAGSFHGNSANADFGGYGGSYINTSLVSNGSYGLGGSHATDGSIVITKV